MESVQIVLHRTNLVLSIRGASESMISACGACCTKFIKEISSSHAQRMSSAIDSGMCPNSLRNFLDGFFSRLRILPPVNDNVLVIDAATDADGAKGKVFELHGHLHQITEPNRKLRFRRFSWR